MKRYLFLLCLVAASLACAGPAYLATPTPASTQKPQDNLVAATPEKTATRQPTQTASLPLGSWTAEVRLPTVNIRKAPSGDATGKYLRAGDRVTVLACKGDWCQIEDPAGWVFRGCLDDNPAKLGCEAR